MITPLRKHIRELYEGPDPVSDRFRYGLMAFDLTTVAYLVSISFMTRGWHTTTLDRAIGVVLLIEVALRLWSASNLRRDLFSIWGLVDVVVVASLLVPVWGEGLAFLRVLRIFRILHSKETLVQLRADFPRFRRNEAAIRAAINRSSWSSPMSPICGRSSAPTRSMRATTCSAARCRRSTASVRRTCRSTR